MSTSLYHDLPLSERHRAELQASAIAEETARQRGYQTVDDLRALPPQFASSQRRAGLQIPVCEVTGQIAIWHPKPDQPRISPESTCVTVSRTIRGARPVDSGGAHIATNFETDFDAATSAAASATAYELLRGIAQRIESRMSAEPRAA